MKRIVHLKESAAAVTGPDKLFDRIGKIDINYDQENFLVFAFNTRQQVISVDKLFIGGLDSMVIDPRTIFRKVLIANAASFLVAHNHPSGQLEPSDEDLAATRKLRAAAKMLHITFCDHVIFNKTEYYSLTNSGML